MVIYCLIYKKEGAVGTMEQEKDRIYTLNDIYIEVWNDEHVEYTKNMTDSDCESAVEQVKSEYRKRLNAMFNALFGYNYNEVLITQKSKSKYPIKANGKDFIIFLLETYSNKNGQILRSNKLEKRGDTYWELDRTYENDLLYYASQYLKERKGQESGDGLKTEELANKLMEKFGMGDGKIKLIEALMDFTNLVNELLHEREIIDTPKLEKVYKDISVIIRYGKEKGNDRIPENNECVFIEKLERIKESIVSYREMLEQNDFFVEGIEELARRIRDTASSEYKDEFLI